MVEPMVQPLQTPSPSSLLPLPLLQVCSILVHSTCSTNPGQEALSQPPQHPRHPLPPTAQPTPQLLKAHPPLCPYQKAVGPHPCVTPTSPKASSSRLTTTNPSPQCTSNTFRSVASMSGEGGRMRGGRGAVPIRAHPHHVSTMSEWMAPTP